MPKKEEELKELDPLNIELRENLEELDEFTGDTYYDEDKKIDNPEDAFKIEYLIRINNNLGYMIRAFLGIEKNLARIADSLEILSAGK